MAGTDGDEKRQKRRDGETRGGAREGKVNVSTKMATRRLVLSVSSRRCHSTHAPTRSRGTAAAATGTRFNIIIINDVLDRASVPARRPPGIDSIGRHYMSGVGHVDDEPRRCPDIEENGARVDRRGVEAGFSSLVG